MFLTKILILKTIFKFQNMHLTIFKVILFSYTFFKIIDFNVSNSYLIFIENFCFLFFFHNLNTFGLIYINICLILVLFITVF